MVSFNLLLIFPLPICLIEIVLFCFSCTKVGVPIKLLHEGEGHVVTVELKNGEVYKGLLSEAEDTMNCQMKEGECCFCIYLPQEIVNHLLILR
jgi:hypothetical protein